MGVWEYGSVGAWAWWDMGWEDCGSGMNASSVLFTTDLECQGGERGQQPGWEEVRFKLVFI